MKTNTLAPRIEDAPFSDDPVLPNPCPSRTPCKIACYKLGKLWLVKITDNVQNKFVHNNSSE